jgi:hypothetical protein
MVSEIMMESNLMVSGQKLLPLVERLVYVIDLGFLFYHW